MQIEVGPNAGRDIEPCLTSMPAAAQKSLPVKNRKLESPYQREPGLAYQTGMRSAGQSNIRSLADVRTSALAESSPTTTGKLSRRGPADDALEIAEQTEI